MYLCENLKTQRMEFLKKIFSSEKNEKSQESKQAISWKMLENSEQLETIKEESESKPVAIFKHSTRCGISRMALNRFEKNYAVSSDEMSLYFLDLLSNRSLSNEIANQFQVVHESPQLIVIRDGKAVYHTSHSGIDAQSLHRFL